MHPVLIQLTLLLFLLLTSMIRRKITSFISEYFRSVILPILEYFRSNYVRIIKYYLLHQKKKKILVKILLGNINQHSVSLCFPKFNAND